MILKWKFFLLIAFSIIILLIMISSITLNSYCTVFSLFSTNSPTISQHVNAAASLAKDLGFTVPQKPVFIIDCSKYIAHFPQLKKFGGHYNEKLNLIVLYKPTANNIYHEYFHFIQDNQYNLNFSNPKYTWVLESSARWFENFTLENCNEDFDCCTSSLFEPTYSMRYDRWMLFRKLLPYGPDTIPNIFIELKKNQDPCKVFRKIPYFKRIALNLITNDFKNNYYFFYSQKSTKKSSLVLQPYQLDFTKVNGPLYVSKENNIHFIAYDENLNQLDSTVHDEEGALYYTHCYILAAINLCHEEKTIRIAQTNYNKTINYTIMKKN